MKVIHFRLAVKTVCGLAAAGHLHLTSSLAVILNVPQCNQESNNWCWAASSQAVLAYYGTNVAQTNIAQFGTGGANVANYIYGAGWEGGIYKRGVDLILNNFAGIASIGTNDLLSLAAVRNEIETNRRPVVIRWLWDTGGGHILAMYGVAVVTNPPITFSNIWLMDPLNQVTINQYNWVCRGGGHTWTHTLPLSTPAPAILVTPDNLDFGRVQLGYSADLNFVLENAGGGWLVGSASVPAPFSVVAGANYRLPGYSGMQVTVRYQPTALASDTQTVTFEGDAGASRTVSGTGSLMLEEALDAPGLTWTSGPPSHWWSRTTSFPHDGVDAARAGTPPSPFEESWMSTTVTGPGIVSFWWALSPFSLNYPYLRFCVGDTELARIQRTSSWQLQAQVVPEGSQTLTWSFGNAQLMDFGMVDQVTYGRSVVVGWGDQSSGKINVPAGLTNVVAIGAGQNHSLALLADGSVIGWGTGYASNNAPARLTNVVAIAAGEAHNLALQQNGTVAAWGATQSNSTNVPPGLINIVAVAAGSSHSLALRSDGTVRAWGDDVSGQTNVPPDLTNVVAIAAGRNFSLALQQNGTVAAWGANSDGQTNVPPWLTNVTSVAAGAYHGLALRQDGTVVAWGRNASGQTNVPAGLSNVVAVAAGESYSLALGLDRKVVAWGANNSGQTNLPGWLCNVVTITAGHQHALAIMSVDSQQPDPLRLANLTYSNHVFSATVRPRCGRIYCLEYKDSLSAATWKRLPLQLGDGTSRTVTDITATGGERFYRLWLQ